MTPAPMGQMQARHVGVTAQEELTRAVVNNARAVGGVVGSFERMQDYNSRAKANLDTKNIQSDMETDFGKRMQAAPGSALSFFDEDGKLNQAKVDGFALEYKEKFESVQPGFWDFSKKAEWENERDGMVQNSMKRMAGQTQLYELENIKRTGDAALKECELNDDAEGYAGEIRRQVEAGVLTEQEGRVKNLAFGKRRLGGIARSGGGVTIDGRDYSGFAASLAAEAARVGYEAPGGHGDRETAEAVEEVEQLSEADTMLPGSPGAPGAEKAMQETLSGVTASEGGKVPITIFNGAPGAGGIDFGDAWLGGDFGGVVKGMSAAEVAAVQEAFEEPRITRKEGENGQVMFECQEYAPEPMKRLVAAANYNGSISKNGMKALVVNRAAGLLADDPDLSAENILKQFEEKGVFEVLGDGDTEAGKTEAKIVVDGLKRLDAGNPDQLEKEAVNRAIELHVNRPNLGVSKDGSMEDWKAVEVASTYLRPKETKNGVPVYGKYEWPKEDAARQRRWNGLKRAYMHYRSEWNAELADKAYSDEDFAEDAGAFAAWFMKSKHSKAREATQNAERDYYRGKVAEEMQRGLRVDKDGNVQVGSYENQVSVLKTVLSQDCPLSDDVRAYLKAEGLREMTAREQRQKLRKSADNAKKMIDAEGRRQRDRRAAVEIIAAQEKERDKQEKAAAKERETQQKEVGQRRMNARRKVKRCEAWGWDFTQDAKEPECTVPQAEIERIKELGWDGVQDVYLLVDGQSGKRVRVRMEEGGNGDTKILFNHLGTMYLQPKKRGKVQRRAVTGDFLYNYDFQ